MSKIVWTLGMQRPELDSFDAQILRLVQGNTRMTAQAIADEVGLSAAACQKRLKRLRESKAIEAEVAILSPSAVGIGVIAIVQIRVVRDKTQELDRFKKAMLAAPEVTQCYYVTGDHNFVVVVAVQDMPSYKRFARKHCIENPDVSHFKTNVVLDRVKKHGILDIPATP